MLWYLLSLQQFWFNRLFIWPRRCTTNIAMSPTLVFPDPMLVAPSGQPTPRHGKSRGQIRGNSATSRGHVSSDSAKFPCPSKSSRHDRRPAHRPLGKDT
ncbi:hypothetical protein EV363DRAFT_1256008 [Boletus edulis]|nr:hypothetical protein EV363DRAFT_1256008 [Boletus edulis]